MYRQKNKLNMTYEVPVCNQGWIQNIFQVNPKFKTKSGKIYQ